MDDSANFLLMIGMIVNGHLSAHSHVLQMKNSSFILLILKLIFIETQIVQTCVVKYNITNIAVLMLIL